MRLPNAGASSETLMDTYGIYHLTRLGANKSMKDLSEAFLKAQDKLKARTDAHKAAQASTMQAMAIRDGEDAALDDLVRAFALGILAKVGNTRKAPLYQKYFPDGLNAIVGAPMDAQIQRTGVILTRLAEEEDESLKTHIGPLTTGMKSLQATMEAHRAALASEVQSYGLLQTEKVNWLDAYKRSYRELTRIYFKEPKKADTYFKPAPKAKKDATTAPEQAGGPVN